MISQVDLFLKKTSLWKSELQKLREILLSEELTEELKWGHPCYTFKNKNIAILGGFKDYCAVSFFKGALLRDPHKYLKQQGKNSHSVRILSFTHLSDIEKDTNVIRNYIKEAIQIEASGQKVISTNISDMTIPIELQEILKENSELQVAFNSLSEGRQKAYLLYFSAAQKKETRITRIKKYMNRILDGKGINDCICGLSQKMPSCDGSHRKK